MRAVSSIVKAAIVIIVIVVAAGFGLLATYYGRGVTSSTSSPTSFSSSQTSTSSTSTNSCCNVSTCSTSESISSSLSSQTENTPVGVFWYLWYGYNYTSSEYTGGPGTSHWNDSATGIVVDRPLQGYYSSMSNNTIYWQIKEMLASGIDFAVISWWGWGVTNFTEPNSLNVPNMSVNNATLNAFRLVEADFPTFKLAIMVDAFNSNGSSFTSMSESDYTSIYNYVSDHFYSEFNNIVEKWNGRPLLFWFNPLDPYPDSRDQLSAPGPANDTFENIDTGNNPYVNMTFWSAPASFVQSYQNIGVSNYEGNPNITTNGIVSITPRYDDYAMFPNGRSSYMRFDVSYNESLYQSEWSYLLNHSRSVKMVLIYSWNEYHERSAIEPHYDSTSAVGPFYLASLTRNYTEMLEDCLPQSSYLPSLDIPSTSIADFTFNNSLASSFYKTLNTTTGLLSTTPDGDTIYLADDQALDFAALKELNLLTGDSTSLSLANQISESIQPYGGLYKSWNGAFTLLGSYPSKWNFSSGNDSMVGTSGPYVIDTTIFNHILGQASYRNYADLELYYVLYELWSGNYTGALGAFQIANSHWNGYGFTDAPYASTGRYDSYKLALDIYVWKALMNNSMTLVNASSYAPVIQQVAAVMSSLQGGGGGVFTNYVIVNDKVSIPSGVSENGETTSVFILAETF